MLDEKVSYSEIDVSMLELGKLDTNVLIDIAAAKKYKVELAKKELDVVSAEIQSRAVAFQEDRHLKFTEFFGTGQAIAAVTVAQSFDILNYFKLKELFGAEFIESKIKIVQGDIKYEVEKAFKQALIALIMEDYDTSLSVEQVLDKAGWYKEDEKKKKLVLKKLKGSYGPDKKVILQSLNIDEHEIDIDEELYCIYQAKNTELIRAFFEDEELDAVKDKLKRCIAVDETAKIGIKYH